MAIIYSYPPETNPQPTDLIIGTSTTTVDGKQTNVTRSYSMQTITDYIKTLGGIGVESITFSAPLTGGTITLSGTVGIPQASGAADGYLSSGDWTTFNNKLGGISGVQYSIPIWSTTAALGNSSLAEPGGGTTVTSSKIFAPALDAATNLGITGTQRWQNLYLSGTASAVNVDTTNVTITGTLSANASTGTSGYILQSFGASPAQWVDLSSAYDTYDLNATTNGGNVDMNLTSTSGTDNSVVKLVAGTNIALTRDTATQVTIDSTDQYTGTVTSISSTNTNILTVATATTTPALSPVMGSVAAANTALVTGGDVKAAIDAALVGFLEFKGGFNATTGEITSGVNISSYIYNCPGGAGTRIAIDVGDFYVVETLGDFYCNTSHALSVGDQAVCSSAAIADASVLGDWTQIQENIGIATATTPGIASFPTGNDGLDITAGGAVSAQVFGVANLTGGYVPDASVLSGDEFLSRDGTFKAGPVSGVSEIIAGNGLSGGTITTSGTIAPDYTTADNIIQSAPAGSTLGDTNTFIVSQGNNVIEDTLANLKTYIGAGTGTITGSGTTYAIPVFSTSTAIGDSIITQDASATTATITGKAIITDDLELDRDLIDINGSPGAAGELLSSLGTGNGVDWIAAPASGVTTFDEATGSASTGNPLTVTGTGPGPYTGAVTVAANIFDGNGKPGVVTATAGDAAKLLQGDGTWVVAGGLPTKTVDNFTGNGVLYQFILTVTPTSVDYTDVYISGVYQQKNTYTLSTATIDFGVSNPVPVTATNGIEVVSTT